MKKTVFIFLALCLLLTFAVCKTPAPSSQDSDKSLQPEELPPLQLPSAGEPIITIESINNTRAVLLVTINIENPNVYTIPAPIINYDYLLNRRSFIRGIIELDKPLAASSVTPVSFNLIVDYEGLFRSFSSLRTANEVASLLVLF
ncbi:MAG: hypothetical protein FWD22_04320, partial [Treponema sp.]|nr:hypothetical protein [Treponema sp.]